MPSITFSHKQPVPSLPWAGEIARVYKVGVTRSQLSNGHPSNLLPSTSDHMPSLLRNGLSESIRVVTTLAKDATTQIMQATLDTTFKDLDKVNRQFLGNFAPVDEIGSRVKVEVVEGAIPQDFPTGVYLRNGPNPQFGGKCKTSSIFGDLLFHWFEGDGMLHATYFGPQGEVFYQNKYVETETYKEEKKEGRQVWLGSVVGDSMAIRMSYLLNVLRFGKVNRVTCNTTVFKHANRLFVNAEADSPMEVDPVTLSTIGPWEVGQQWGIPFTSHPKVIRDTNEMVVFGFSPLKPHYKTGIISADGKRFVHACDVELNKPMFSHEIAITENFDIIMYMPFTIDLKNLLVGKPLFNFDDIGEAKFGIKPRYGDASSIQWFPVDTHYSFHLLNSYEDGHEVVLHACRAKRPLIVPPPGMGVEEYYTRGISSGPTSHVHDPQIDGSLFATIHEWRFNLQTGDVVERDVTKYTSSFEWPKINESYVGYKNKYAYAEVVDHEASMLVGMPKFGKLVKLTFGGKDEDCSLEFHSSGQGVFYSEPLFVSKPNAFLEDDGWIVTYTHNELTSTSEVHIIDAKNFSNPPIAKIKLPQRVPYGFHSTFMNGLF